VTQETEPTLRDMSHLLPHTTMTLFGRTAIGRLRKRVADLLLGVALVVMATASCAEPPQVGVEQFFRHPDIRAVQASPNGNYVALEKRFQAGRYGVVVVSTLNPSDIKVVAAYKNIDCIDVHWVSENRLTFSMTNLEGDPEAARGFSNIYAVDRDGKNLLDLSPYARKGEPFGVLGYGIYSNALIIGHYKFVGADGHLDRVAPYEMDTRTGATRPMIATTLPAHSKGWLFDRAGVARIFSAGSEGRATFFYRSGPNAPWEQIGDFDTVRLEGFVPVFFGYDDALYVLKTNPKGYWALYRYNVAKHQVDSDSIVEVDGFDYAGIPMMDPEVNKVLGFRFLSDAWGTIWTNKEMQAIQKDLDSALPGTVNIIHCSSCLSSPVLVVGATSDRQPTRYLLFNRSTKELTLLGDSRPELDGVPMGRREFSSFQARDGLSIPVYVTRPPGAAQQPYPTVVLVHGGPWVRGSSWEWSLIPQFLASRGYLVVEPEFRGSRGFGYSFFKASWHQWGLSMQDDLADAAKWAIDQGLADPNRIAIGGASYGGYATLMGLAKNPELFRCGFEWLGVTDINLMYTETFNDASFEQMEYTMPTLIGDPDKDAEQIKATSPIANAKRISQPILMAYGGRDRRVPLANGTEFRSAVAKTNSNVEWIEYQDEGHGWYYEKDDIDFWQHVEKFLAKNLGAMRGQAGDISVDK
jgi:acetyl esterase/lipase